MLRTIAVSLTMLIATTLVGCGSEAPMTATAPNAPVAAQARAQAQPTQGDRVLAFAAKELKKFDRNQDGTLSQTEYVDARFADMRFVKAPTAAETATVKAGIAKKFTELDANHDRKLTVAEFAKDFV